MYKLGLDCLKGASNAIFGYFYMIIYNGNLGITSKSHKKTNFTNAYCAEVILKQEAQNAV